MTGSRILAAQSIRPRRKLRRGRVALLAGAIAAGLACGFAVAILWPSIPAHSADVARCSSAEATPATD